MWRQRQLAGAAVVLATAGAGLATVLSLSPAHSGERATPRAPVSMAAVGIPLSFERNVGQAQRGVRFLARGPGSTLYLSRAEAAIAVAASRSAQGTTDLLRMRLVGANRNPSLGPAQRQPGTVNYLVGDKADWRRQIPTYGRVTYRGVYHGIDLAYHGSAGQLEYDFDVAPGADPRKITMQMTGARALRLDAAGRLEIALAHSTLVQQAPVVYQVRDGVRREISGRYVLRGSRHVGFAIGAHDPATPLVIDPKITFSTYLGGSKNDVATSVAVDRAGNTYVAGSTTSSDLVVRNPIAPRRPARLDAFVTKISPGGRLVYSTYLGGEAYTDGRGIAVDRLGHAYVTGGTGSHQFPTVNAFQPDYGGGPFDAYVAKLSVSGRSLLYSTFLGGPRNDRGYAIAVDTKGSAVVGGRTAHDGFVYAGRLHPGLKGGAFVTKLAASGKHLVYSTVLGGNASDNTSDTAFGVALDAHSDAYITGITAAADFPTTSNAVQPRYGGGLSNAFVTKINARGSAILYSTYLGGSGEDEGLGIAVDRAGSAFVTGHTTSPDFPTAGSALLGAPIGDASGAFVTKLATTGRSLVYSIRLGGNGEDAGNAIAVTPAGNAYVTGQTSSPDFPVANAVQAHLAGPSDAFVTSLSRDGSNAIYSTYLGGSGPDDGTAIALDRRGTSYLVGQTESPDFASIRPVQPPPAKRATTAGGGGSAFLTKVASRP
jgi:hypothetical protein